MRILSFFLVLFICTNLLAQKYEEDYTPLRRMSVYSWAGKNGLISKNINATIQSSDGYLWLATYSGIMKFDGDNAKLFDKSNLPFLTTDGFKRLYESRDKQTLYFASQADGVIQYKNKIFEPLKIEDGKVPNSIACLFVDTDGSILIGTSNSGLYKYQNKKIEPVLIDHFDKKSVLDIKKDDHGTIWVGTEGDGLFGLLKDGNILHYSTKNGLTSNVINTLYFIDDLLYIGALTGIHVLKDKKISQLQFMKDKSINCILSHENKIWIGSDNGLGRINKINNKTEFITALEATSLTRINHLQFDNEGSLWISTGRDGLIQMRHTGINNYTTFDGLTSGKINIIVEDTIQNGYYIGCDDGNLFMFKNDKINEIDLLNQHSSTGIRDVLPLVNGDIWIASYHGLILKKGNKETTYDLNDGLPSLDVRRILKDSQGTIWVGTRSGGLAKILNEKVVEVYNSKNKLHSNFILSIEEGRNNKIYLGTHSGGLSVIDSAGTIRTYNISGNDAGIIIFNIHISDNGEVWVVTNSGLYQFDNDMFYKLSLINNFSGLSYFDWLENKNGDVFITSTQGIIIIEKNEIDLFRSNHNTEIKSTLINKNDGMIESECTAAVRALFSQENQLWIPTIKGVSVIDPNRIKINKNIPRIYIEGIKADDLLYDSSGSIIPPGKTRYSIEYTALSYIATDQIKFKYKLDGLDDDFIEATNIRKLEYTNLAPGDYTFNVKAANSDGIWNEEGSSFSFTIAAQYYQTPWFYTLVIFGSLFFIFGIYKWRIYAVEKMNLKLRKVNSELDSFVYSASHDLRSPLASILGLINLSKKDAKNTSLYLDMIQTSVKKLDSFISDIIDFSSNERKEIINSEINFRILIEKVFDELEFLNPSKKIAVNLDIVEPDNFFSDQRRISIILRNLISNAFKYKDELKSESWITIKVTGEKTGVEISVIDNGIGIHSNSISNIFDMFYRATELSSGSGLGLYIVRETVEKLQGSIKVSSKPRQGSTFTIVLPSLSKKISIQ